MRDAHDVLADADDVGGVLLGLPRPAATLALLAGAAGVRAQEEAPEGVASYEGVEVVDVRFDGAVQLPPVQLESAIRTRDTRCTLILPLCWLGFGIDEHYLDPGTLAADELRLRLFYYERGFRNAQVAVRVEPAE